MGVRGRPSACLLQPDRQMQALVLLMVPASITEPSTVQLLFLRGIRNLLTSLPSSSLSSSPVHLLPDVAKFVCQDARESLSVLGFPKRTVGSGDFDVKWTNQRVSIQVEGMH